jgi:type II secretory pathway component GspD/PulD (secretin)
MQLLLLMFIVVFTLGACTHPARETHDPSVAKTEEDFRTLVAPVPAPLNEKQSLKDQKSSPLPPSPWPEILLTPLSIHITPAMHIEDVLEVLCEKAGTAYLLDPDMEGHLSYQATNRPFAEILETLCDRLNLTFSFDNDLLKIGRDLPYLKTYPLAFIAQTRQSESHVANNTSIVSGGAQEANQNNGSNHVLDTKSLQDFWGELEATLKILLPAPSHFSIQKHGGLVHVYTTHKMHGSLQSLFEKLRAQINTQVLIEAKIVEVTLKDAYKGGIDWAQLTQKPFAVNAQLGGVLRTSPALMGHTSPGGTINMDIQSHHVKTVLNFIESFGTVRTLSSPRITVLHNQNALLKVAENQVFFHVKYERQFLNNDNENYGSVIASHSQIQTIPIGLVLSVQPAIHQETQEIILNLRPTISRIVGTREDPSVRLMAQTFKNTDHDIGSEIPIVAIREMDSVLKLKSGRTAILGGLMIEGSDQMSSGLPGTRDKSFSFFTSTQRSNRMMTELVIFLKATIVDSAPIEDADHRLYEGFTKDPRPLEREEGGNRA